MVHVVRPSSLPPHDNGYVLQSRIARTVLLDIKRPVAQPNLIREMKTITRSKNMTKME